MEEVANRMREQETRTKCKDTITNMGWKYESLMRNSRTKCQIRERNTDYKTKYENKKFRICTSKAKIQSEEAEENLSETNFETILWWNSWPILM